MRVSTPHFAVPFRIGAGGPIVVEQGSKAEILSCVETVLGTRVGSRIEEPEFGIPDHLFELISDNTNVDDVLAAVEEWEPRVRVLGRANVEDLVKRVVIETEYP